MADKDYFDDWYKHKLDGLRFNPSEEVWDQVEDTLDTDQVWTRLENSLDIHQVWANLETSLDIDAVWNRVDESLDLEEVWGRVDESLDLDQVWTRIEATLDEERNPRGIIWWWRGAAAAILLLGVLGYSLWNGGTNKGISGPEGGLATLTEMRPFYGNQNAVNQGNPDGVNGMANPSPNHVGEPIHGTDPLWAEKTPQQDGANHQTGSKPVKGKNTGRPSLGKQAIKEQYALQQNRNASQTHKALAPDQSDDPNAIHLPGVNDLSTRKDKILDYIRSKGVVIAANEIGPGTYIPDPTLAQPEEELKKRIDPQFFVGGSMGVKNQWLMAHDTYASFKKTEQQTTELDFAGTMGVNAGMQLTRKLGIQTDYILRSTAGQKYVDYTDGRNVDRELDFNYQSLLLTARINRKEGTLLKKPIVDHFNVGMYGGLLTQAQEQISGKTISDIAEDYKTYDMGLSIGYGVDIRPAKDVIAGFGLRLQQGLVNTYEGNTYLPSSLNPTYNTSVDFIFNLRYSLHKK